MAEDKTYSALSMDRSEPLGNSLDVEGRRALHVKDMAKLITKNYDSGTVEYPNPTTEIYKFKTGGMSGTVVQTVTLVYTDASKKNLAGWETTTP